MMAMLIALAAVLAAPAQAKSPEPRWTGADLAALHAWVAKAPEDALPAPDAAELEAAERLGDGAAVDRAADGVALTLVRMHLVGCCGARTHAGWHIADTDRTDDLPARIGRGATCGAAGTSGSGRGRAIRWG